MENLISINATPASFDINYDALVQAVKKETEKYSIVVTRETVADAKLLIQSINKTKRSLEIARKETLEIANRPARDFDKKMKALVELYNSSVTPIREQIQRFDNESKAEILELLKAYCQECWEKSNVLPEFQKASMDSLALLGAVTPKNALKAVTRQKIEDLVAADLKLQNTTQQRIDELVSRSKAAGLKSPITQNLVQHFLFQPDAAYNAALKTLIDGELVRQAEALKIIEQESQQLTCAKEQQQSNVTPLPLAQTQLPVAAPISSIPLPTKSNDAGNHHCASIIPSQSQSSGHVIVDATFEFTAPRSVSDEAIKKQITAALAQIGVTCTTQLSIRRSTGAA